MIWFTSSYNFFGQPVTEDQSILASVGRIVGSSFPTTRMGEFARNSSYDHWISGQNVIGTFGILFGHKEVAENGREIWQALQGTYTSAAAYSLLSFNLLCAPCFAAIGAIHREMNSRKWTLIAVGYQCGFAW